MIPSDPGLGSGLSEPDSLSSYDALRSGGAAVNLRRDVLRVAGPDATGFLQGQLSQDVASLGVAASAWSWLLQPSGKVDALLRVVRIGDEELLLDTDRGWAEAVAGRLNRFKLRTKVEIEQLAGWDVIGLRGDDLEGSDLRDGVVVDGSWPGLPGVDLIGLNPSVPAGFDFVSAEIAEAVRVESGMPKMGAELSDRTIPAETGLIEETVSFTKGCYTGQELVARIDSRGSKVPRRMVGARLGEPVPAGTTLVDSLGAEVGVLTSVARSPRLGCIALGYLKRGVEFGAFRAEVPGDPLVEIASLPLVGDSGSGGGEQGLSQSE